MPADAASLVRTLTGLGTAELSDDEILALLDINGAVVLLAAASALEVVAGNLLSISAESDDIKIDGSKRAAVLMARAARMRTQAGDTADEDGFTFDVVPAYGCSAPELTGRWF